MISYQLKRKPKLSRRTAHDMIQIFAKFGNHNKPGRFETDADVKRAFASNGIDYERLVENCRDPASSVPFFENLIGSTWTVSGASIAQVDMTTGEEITRVEGPGIFSPDAYWATYELAHRALDRATSGLSYAEFLSAAVHGVASIESFLAAQFHEWNRKNPGQALQDSKTAKVSFDDKIDQWIPRVTGGKKLDKSGRLWQAFRLLQALRDDVGIHPKAPGHGVRFQELADLINVFRSGIAGLLIDLHILFGIRIPRTIIRDAHAPDVDLVEVRGQQ